MGLVHETIGWDAKQMPFYLVKCQLIGISITRGWRTLYLEEDESALQAVKGVVLDRSFVMAQFPGKLRALFDWRTSFGSMHGADTVS
jgi:hypothetical protein